MTSTSTTPKLVGIVSTKGGVGKTTLALNLGWALAARGWRVLVADTDPLGGLAASVLGAAGKTGLGEVLLQGADPQAQVVTTRSRDFDLLPLGPLATRSVDEWMARASDPTRLRAALTTAGQGHDVVLVDTPPGLYGATRGVLRAVDGVLVPLMAEPLAARALQPLLATLADLREREGGGELLGIVLTLLQSRQASSLDVARESWRLFPGGRVFDTSIPRDEIFLEASAAGVPVALLRQRPPAMASLFDALAAELEPRLQLETASHERAIPLLG